MPLTEVLSQVKKSRCYPLRPVSSAHNYAHSQGKPKVSRTQKFTKTVPTTTDAAFNIHLLLGKTFHMELE